MANDADLIDAVHAPPENAQKSVLSYALYLSHRESRLREEDARWDESFSDPEKLARFNCRAAQSTLSSEMAFSEWLSYVSGVMQSTTFGGIIHSDPEIMGGTPVFVGTRVPLQNLIDSLVGGDSMDDFLAGFPSVTREQVIAVIEAGRLKMLETV